MANNQIDLGQIYGLSGNNRTNITNIPTLEEIAGNRNMQNTTESYPTIDTFSNMNTSGFDLMEDINKSLESIDKNNSQGLMIPDSSNNQENEVIYSAPSENIMQLNGFLHTQVGRMVEVQFVAGNNQMIVLTGTLMGVGTDFLLIKEQGSNNLTTCDFYNVELVRMYY